MALVKTFITTTLAAAALAFGGTPATAATTIDFANIAAGDYGSTLTVGEVTFYGPDGLAIREYLDPDGVTRKRICAYTEQSCQIGLRAIFAEPVANLGMTLASVGEDYQRVITSVAHLQVGQTVTDNFRLPPHALYTLSFGALQNIAAFSFASPQPLTLTVGDIRFDTISAVPEPATWALLLIGFGLIGVGLRRRERQLQFG